MVVVMKGRAVNLATIDWRKHLLWFGMFFGLALLITFPAMLNATTQVMGGTTGDNFEMLRNIWWFKFALQTGEPLYYQTYLGYPQGFSSLILAANQLQYVPAYLFAFILPLTLAYNLIVWLTLALNGYAMTILMRDLLGEDVPALFAGVIFATAPTLQAHLAEGHAGLLVMWAVPLFVWAVFRALHAETHVWRWGLAAIVFFNLSPSGHMLQVIYVLMPLLACFFIMLIWQRQWRSVRRLFVICALAGGFMLVFLLPMIRDTLATNAYTEAGGVVRYSADLLSIVSPSFFHPLWSNLPWTRDVLGTNMAEGSSYIGIVVLILAVMGAWKWHMARWFVLLTGIAYVLSLGSLLKIGNQPVVLNLGDYQTYLPLPWALVQDVTGFSLARTPGRFNFTLAFAMAAMAGFGACWLWGWGQHRNLPRTVQIGGLVALAALSIFDTQMFFPVPTRDTDIPQAIYDLRNRDDLQAVFSVPWEHLLAAKDTLYLQTAHEKPLIAGQITRQTPVDPAKLNVLQHTLSPSLLRENGADIVILHKDRAEELDLLNDLQNKLTGWGTPYYEDATIAVYLVPEATTLSGDGLQATQGGDFESRYVTDFYAAEVGWIDFSATLVADNRQVTVLLDNVVYQTLALGESDISLPLPIEQAGFHRLELRLDPACPTAYSPQLQCRTLTVSNPTLKRTDNEFLRPLIPFERGVTLVAASVNLVNNQVEARLWWSFDETISESDVRFVHVLPINGGAPVAQVDSAIGAITANTQRLELVTISLPDIVADDYSVRTGWYTFPELVRFAVLDNALVGADDNAPQIGEIRVIAP